MIIREHIPRSSVGSPFRFECILEFIDCLGGVVFPICLVFLAFSLRIVQYLSLSLPVSVTSGSDPRVPAVFFRHISFHSRFCLHATKILFTRYSIQTTMHSQVYWNPVICLACVPVNFRTFFGLCVLAVLSFAAYMWWQFEKANNTLCVYTQWQAVSFAFLKTIWAKAKCEWHHSSIHIVDVYHAKHEYWA